MVTEIVVGVAVAVTAIVSLILCVCGKSRDKYLRYPNGNRHPSSAEDNNNDKREEEDVTVRERNNHFRTDFEPDSLESARPKTLTINRKLPEIPHSAVDASGSELITDLYATVDETTTHSKTPTVIPSVLNSPVPSTSSLQAIQQSVVSSEAPTGSRPVSITDRPAEIYEEERHNYAKIKGQNSDDRDVDTDTYCDPHGYAGTSEIGANGSDLTTQYEPPPPPVPEKYYELVTDAGTSTQSLTSSAASAIAGNPSIADIPFMTSPIPSNQNLNYIEDSDTYTRTDTVIQEIRYTSISVREPLANIRAQMTRPVTTVSAAAVLVESHYSIVPEDVDQTYAEIESAQHSTTSSMTYSRIDAPDGERTTSLPIASTHYPPAPPTVESLRTVAQAHSRHTSSSSCISDNGHQHSPATDRSFDLNDAGDGRSSASPDFGAIYSVVDKSKKSRATVHVMEDGGHSSGSPSVAGGTIEDMYAKVFKKRGHALLTHDSGVRPKQRPNTMDASHHAIAHDNPRQSGDSCYEKIRNVGSEEHGPSVVVFDGVEIRKKKKKEYLVKGESFDENGVNSDPGYEVVKSKNQTMTSFPNYETINGRFKEDDAESEIGYEVVKNRSAPFSRSDPNYESVRYTGGGDDGRVGDPDEAAAAASRWSDALYERINGREDDDQSDPNYEKVKTVSESSYETSEPGYERVTPKRNLLDVEDGYERIRNRGGPLVSRRPAVEPGYELIKNGNSSSEESGVADALYAVPSEHRIVIDLAVGQEQPGEILK